MPQALIFEEVARFFETHVPSHPEGRRICAGVSGGCDSVALFRALFALRERLGIVKLGIAHVNHRLRGAESDADAAFVKDLSVMAGAPFHEKILRPRRNAPGMEAWARAERYGFFKLLRETEGYDYLATGHTADDQTETVLMRIMRGSGLRGLRGIAPVRDDRVIRPLLHIPKASLRAWLMEARTPFREDSSNTDLAYKRNLVRHRVVPGLLGKEPFARELLPRIAREAENAWRLLVCNINKWIDQHVVFSSEDRFEIRKSGFAEFPFADEAVAEALRRKNIRFERLHIEKIVSNAERRCGLFLLPGGWRYRCEREVLSFTLYNSSAAAPEEYSYDLTIGKAVECRQANARIHVELLSGRGEFNHDQDNMTVHLDADTIKGPLQFRNCSPGDVFHPLGCSEPRELKAYLKKRKKNHSAQGVVAEKNGRTIWIPGVQICEPCKVTPKTSAVLKFSCKTLQ
jgi:tRNA(Ile)-lysidine synthase